MIDQRLRLAHLQHVLAKAITVREMAARYRIAVRTARDWAEDYPISCKLINGSRRISVPLCDVLILNGEAPLWRLLKGDVDPIISGIIDKETSAAR
jgi:hypothetical protein